MSRRRVVITGMGTVNPLANTVPEYWAGLLAGRSGIAPLTLLDAKEFRVTFGGEVKNFDPVAATGITARDARRLDRFSQFALAATQEAVRDAGLDFSKEDPLRCGVIMGCGIGGLATFEEAYDEYRTGGPRRINLLVIPKMIANAAPGNVSIHFGLMGINTSVATACASAGNAVGDALRAIRYDEADVMISGGTEAAITPMGLGGFCSLRALSQRNDDPPRASRPFDKDRDGFVLSEGAGVVVLEEYERAKKRGAPIYAEVLGSGATADAFHITAPHEEGKGAIAAMRAALRDARISADTVDYVNAHGTSTDLGDVAETKAIKEAFGPHARQLAVSSTKSMIGHLLGASGGVELIACVLSIRHSAIHPTINLQTPDQRCDLDYVPNTARQATVRVAISNSFGFGGHNACVVVGAV
jgi:3-oxoacyl-[acyl-carrier-protein] synthase II